jgi:dolichol kinase
MKIEFFKKVFAGKKEIIKGSIFFFAANLLFSLFSDYFRNKSLVNCKNYLRRRVIMIIEKKGEESSKMKTMVNNLLTEIELFSPLFTFIPHKIFVSLFGILVNILYLKKFPTDRLINYFLVISSTSIFVSNLFTYSEQKKNSRRQNLYRIKENASIENFIDKKMTK